MSPERSPCAQRALRSLRLGNRRPLSWRSAPESDRESERTDRPARQCSRSGTPVPFWRAPFFPVSVAALVARGRSAETSKEQLSKLRRSLPVDFALRSLLLGSDLALDVPKLTARKTG